MKTSLMACGLAIAFLTGCTSMQVISDMDSTEDFTEFSTYEYAGWEDDSDEQISRFDKERIEKAFGEELSKRGMTYVENDGDVIISLFITGAQKTERVANTTSTDMGYGGYYGMRRPGWGWGTTHSTTTITENDYVEGSLMIQMFDKADEKLIWHAMGTKRVDEDPKNRDKSIPKAVARIMQEYPVAIKK